MTPNTDPTNALDLAAAPCADCAATTRWERRDLTPTSEAWLGICEECGTMMAFVPGEPDLELDNPLAFFLTGDASYVAPAERPAWQRFYTLTTGAPFFLRWSFQTTPCESCHTRATVETRILSPAWRRSLSLCLNCGRTTVETASHATDATPTRLTGTRVDTTRPRGQDPQRDGHRDLPPLGRIPGVETAQDR